MDNITLAKQESLIALSAVAKKIALPKQHIKATRSGQRLSTFKGRGMEFDEARPYQQGDDIRSIDWKVTARTQVTHTKLFRQERERPVHLWIDQRKNMQFATQRCYKSVSAAQISSILAWSALAHSDRVGGMIFSENQHQEIRPKMGRKSVLQLIHFLSQAQDLKAPLENSESALDHAIFRLRQTVKPGSLVYCVSDFFQFNLTHQQQLAQLSRHNDLALVHVFDPIETELPPAGTYSVESQRGHFNIKTHAKKIRHAYHASFEQRQQQLNDLCLKHGMHYLSISTAEDPSEILSRQMSN